jgi:hypothetical protein
MAEASPASQVRRLDLSRVPNTQRHGVVGARVLDTPLHHRIGNQIGLDFRPGLPQRCIEARKHAHQLMYRPAGQLHPVDLPVRCHEGQHKPIAICRDFDRTEFDTAAFAR